ncbi:MAG: radical SAM protein [Nitrospirae bacterium]|nr:radical SAM protein [Nitrospirota bacterium]
MTDNYSIDGHKLIWHLDRVHAWQVQRVIPPIYVEISPVSFCNHRCVFCGVDFAMQKKQQLDTGILCERLKEMGSLGVKSIMYAGEGEPLLHKDLPRIISVTKKSGIDVAITTNGSLGNSQIWTEILPYLAWIKFSVDAGTAAVYSKVHKVAANFFDKTLYSIKQAVHIKNEKKLDVTIGVQFLIIEENITDIRNALELFSSFGIDYFVLKPYSLHPKMLKKRDITYTQDIINGVQSIADEYRAQHGMHVVLRKSALEMYKKGTKDFKHCYALPFWGYISANGDFYTCSVFIGDERFGAGNIYADDMQTVLFGQRRENSIEFGSNGLAIKDECRVNCRMARVNEFLEFLNDRPRHINFV